jgi:hypothetical protein
VWTHRLPLELFPFPPSFPVWTTSSGVDGKELDETLFGLFSFGAAAADALVLIFGFFFFFFYGTLR